MWQTFCFDVVVLFNTAHYSACTDVSLNRLIESIKKGNQTEKGICFHRCVKAKSFVFWWKYRCSYILRRTTGWALQKERKKERWPRTCPVHLFSSLCLTHMKQSQFLGRSTDDDTQSRSSSVLAWKKRWQVYYSSSLFTISNRTSNNDYSVSAFDDAIFRLNEKITAMHAQRIYIFNSQNKSNTRVSFTLSLSSIILSRRQRILQSALAQFPIALEV